jgi:hypothetical protein
MQITHAGRMQDTVRVHQHREGSFRYRRLLTGEPGTPGNFVLELVTTTNDFFSPRHRHNFDQFRYQVEGTFDFDRNGKMKPGVLGYFPEATPYGPQSSDEHSLTLTLQFGGASGSGYMAAEQIEIATEALKKLGRFEKGVFHRNEGEEGTRNLDGYQALWEHTSGRPMVYPRPRYHDPIMMYPDHYDWIAIAGSPGVYTKLTGMFTERGTEARFLKLDPGARASFGERKIGFVTHGAGSVGQAGNYERHTAFLADAGETIDITASAPSEILVLGLPHFETAAAQSIAAE